MLVAMATLEGRTFIMTADLRVKIGMCYNYIENAVFDVYVGNVRGFDNVGWKPSAAIGQRPWMRHGGFSWKSTTHHLSV